MVSYKIKTGLLGLVLLICSCSKNTIIGSYTYNGSSFMDDRHLIINKHLELNKDSSFKYTESYQKELNPGEDVGYPAYDYFGKGHFTINQKQLILNFDPKFRKIDKIEIIPISSDEIARIRKKHGSDPIDADKIAITCHIFINSYQFGNDRNSNIGYLHANGDILPLSPDSYKEYKKEQFPLELLFDFGGLTENYETGYIGFQYPDEHNVLGFSLGFGDEKIRIEKPGNYKVDIYLFKSSDQTADQAFTGKRVFLIKTSFGTIKIGEMKKTKELKVNSKP
jgi:hypothetical protein